MNKEEKREYAKKYRAANKEKIAEYRAANKEKIAEYRAANKERIAEYYAANKERIAKQKAGYNRTFKAKWISLKNRARRKGLPVEITFEQWLAIVEPKECYYCEGPLPEVGYGIDRIDSSKGYVEGNCVPCCTICNVMLLNHNNEDAFKHMEKMISVRGKRIVAKNANK
jgi:hypothetical protein